MESRGLQSRYGEHLGVQYMQSELSGKVRVGGPLGVAGRLSGTLSPFRAEQGTSLVTPWRARASSCQEVGTTWFFSSCGGILELQRQSGGAPALRPGGVAQSLGREASLAWASLAQRFPASSVLGREGAGCGRESRRNSRKTTWFPPLGKMRPLPATASQAKSPVPP